MRVHYLHTDLYVWQPAGRSGRRSSGSSPAWWTSSSGVLHPQPTGRRRRAEAMGAPGGLWGLRAEEVEERRGAHLMAGGPGRARSWLGEEEGRGSRDGRGRRRWGGQRRRRRRVGPRWRRRRSGPRGWLGEVGEGREGYSTRGWWRAGR